MRLFVDDTREFPKSGYECVRDAQSAIQLLSVLKFEHISLDYDLGYGCMNGLDILVWMRDHHVFVPSINIHSSHIFGVGRMKRFCEENFPNTELTTRMVGR